MRPVLLFAALLVSCAKDPADTNETTETGDSCTEATWYADADADGFGDATAATTACDAPAGAVADATDCNDTDAAINPAATEACTDLADRNCDGVAGGSDGDADGAPACEDCNDGDPTVQPGATEICNGADDDCDGAADDDAVDQRVWYADDDGDGHGDATRSETACEAPEGHVATADDCADDDASRHPGAAETDCADPIDRNCDGSVAYTDRDADGFPACRDCDDADAAVNADATEACNAIDDDCDAAIDEAGATGERAFYLDDDGDGYGDPATLTLACTAPSTDHIATSGDCDDTDDAYYPGAIEACDDPNDYNCDGSVAYDDDDADGFAACEECDDGDADVNPDAAETCNHVDDDCDGTTDEPDATDATTWYFDADGDGYGSDDVTDVACDTPDGYVSTGGDCNDTDASYAPSAAEACDDPTDYNCDGVVDYADTDGDGFPACLDCDDTDGAVNEDAAEVCNGIDDDCDGDADEDDATDAEVWYLDADGDGHGDPETGLRGCARPTGYVADGTDCDDGESKVHPGHTEVCDGLDNDCDARVDADAADAKSWYADADEDGFGSGDVVKACAAPTGHVALDTDCDDTRAAVNPAASEACNLLDDDCDGTTDEPDALDALDWYADTDGDGFGDPAAPETACDAPTGFVSDQTDCDDGDGDVSPDALEVCNGVDDDCDTVVDPDTAADVSPWYNDGDSDGYGDPVAITYACEAPTGYLDNSLDCDDTRAVVNPDAVEICNGRDDDCDASVDPVTSADVQTWYLDADSDTYGGLSSTKACAAPTGYVDTSTDCDDTKPAVNPAATEVCNSVDDDCDTVTDPTTSADAKTWYLDADSDTYGGLSSTKACTVPTGYVATSTDCDDTKSAINPGAAEVCNSVDDDCDTVTDPTTSADAKTWYLDSDSDAYGGSTSAKACTAPTGYVAATDDCDDTKSAINPGAAEVCNSVDDDCDTAVDDGLDQSWYPDTDGDGFGRCTGSCEATIACAKPTGYAAVNTDCDDAAANTYPGAPEYCDGKQTDCSVSSWTTASENGLVSTESTSGAWSASSWSTVSTTVTSVTLPTSGTVWVCPGTYYTKLSAPASSSTTLSGRYGSSTTILDANDTGTLLTVASTSAVTVSGLTLQNGKVTGAGGGVNNAGTLTMSNSRITSNIASTNGGGLFGAANSTTTLTNVAVDANAATGTTGANGGGLHFAANTTWTLSGTTVSGNTSTGLGGGIGTAGSSGSPSKGTLSGSSTVSGNTATTNGGGIYVSVAEVTCTGSTSATGIGVVGNRSNTAGGGTGAGGGGVYLSANSANKFTAVNCDFGTTTADDNYAGATPVVNDLSVTSGTTKTYGNDANVTCAATTGAATCTP